MIVAGAVKTASGVEAVKTYLSSLLTSVDIRWCPSSNGVDFVLAGETQFDAELGKMQIYMESMRTRVEQLPAAMRTALGEASLLSSDDGDAVAPDPALAITAGAEDTLKRWNKSFAQLKNSESARAHGAVCLRRMLRPAWLRLQERSSPWRWPSAEVRGGPCCACRRKLRTSSRSFPCALQRLLRRAHRTTWSQRCLPLLILDRT